MSEVVVGSQNECKPEQHPDRLPRKVSFAADKRRSGETVGRGLARAAVHQSTHVPISIGENFLKKDLAQTKRVCYNSSRKSGLAPQIVHMGV